MYHYKARIYSPTLGRFLQPDPIGFAGGMNVYDGMAGDPTNRTDSTGLLPKKPLATCTGTRITSGCGAGGVADSMSGSTTAGVGGRVSRDYFGYTYECVKFCGTPAPQVEGTIVVNAPQQWAWVANEPFYLNLIGSSDDCILCMNRYMAKLSRQTCQAILNVAEAGDNILEETSSDLADIAVAASVAAPVSDGATLPIAGAAVNGLGIVGAGSAGMKMLKGLATGDFRQMTAAITGNAIIKGALRSRSAELAFGGAAEKANSFVGSFSPKPVCD